MGALGFRNLDSRRSRIEPGLHCEHAFCSSPLAFCDRSLHGTVEIGIQTKTTKFDLSPII